jgi:hypothetical protein
MVHMHDAIFFTHGTICFRQGTTGHCKFEHFISSASIVEYMIHEVGGKGEKPREVVSYIQEMHTLHI